MNDIDFLWTTDPGWAALAILILAIVFLVAAHLTKYHWVLVVIDLIFWIMAIATIGGVLDLWTLPSFLDWWNVPAAIPID